MTNSVQNPNPLINYDAVAIAQEAFIYGLPLVLVDLTKEQSLQSGNDVNAFLNKTQFSTPSDVKVVRPNCDTFYSSAFFDLSSEPLVLSIPETDTQYYMMPLLDAFTNVIPGSPGTRTNQTQQTDYLLVGPKHRGTAPSGYTVIDCPTDMVWAIGRFQVNNPSQSDYTAYGGAQVIQLQSLLKITNLNGFNPAYGIDNTHYPSGPPTQTPNEIIQGIKMPDFFARLNALLINNPPTIADAPAMERFAKIGVGPDATRTFEEKHYTSETITEMNKIPMATVNNLLTPKESDNPTEWTVNLSQATANYGTKYLFRAQIAYNGLGANLVDDVVYFSSQLDSNKLKLDGSNNYTITFDALPPNKAFWSLTMYNEAGLLVENTIDRYALGHDVVYPLVTEGADNNRATIYIQNSSSNAIPESDTNKYPNWLPSPDSGNFNVMLRIYWPEGEVINQVWNPPTIVKVS